MQLLQLFCQLGESFSLANSSGSQLTRVLKRMQTFWHMQTHQEAEQAHAGPRLSSRVQ